MDAKGLNKKKNEKFLKYWEKKRIDKKKYLLKSTAAFSFPISIIYSLIHSNFSLKFIHIFPIAFLICTIIYGLYVYFIEYNLQEKRYQKLKKEKQNFDQ